MAVPNDVMQHVVHIESAFNPYAIGVVGGKLARQPRNLAEALATVRMLEGRGYNFSVGLAQVNRHNLARYGLDSYERAFQSCPNLQAGSRILAECYARSRRDWGKSFSCYYSGNFTTGFRHGYVQKIFASMHDARKARSPVAPIAVIDGSSPKVVIPSKVDDMRGQQLSAQRSGAAPSLLGHQLEGYAEAEGGAQHVQVDTQQPINGPPPSGAINAIVAPESKSTPSDEAFVF